MNLSSAYIASLAFLAKTATAVTPSPGCSPTFSPPNPASWDESITFLGTDYSHKYSYPSQASDPVPLLMYFHGWGGDSGSCGSTCTSADERGYATISLTGIGGENGDYNSWNGFGSTESGLGVAALDALTAGTDNCDGDSSEDDRTCNVNNSYNVDCYQDCAVCADDCWWTTCKDSVQQTLDVLTKFTDDYCVDMDRIYASGCSNGGMFVYELANNEKSYAYFAGIATQVGLPHYGYNRGPYKDPQDNVARINHIGFWGSRDRTVPPTENASATKCFVPGRTSEGRGWFYTSSDYVMEKWATDLDISLASSLLTKYGIPDESSLSECTAYGAEDDVVVLGCIFTGGHVCNQDYMNDVMLNFFDELDGPSTSPDPTSEPTPAPTDPGTPAPVTPSCVDVGGSCAAADRTCCGGLTCSNSNPKKCE